MTTSGVYSFSVSRDEIIRESMLNIGRLDETEVPSAQETTDCARKLNLLVKQWQGQADGAPGLKTWTRRHGHLFLSSITGQYTVGPGAVGWTNSYVSTTTVSAAAGAQAVVIVNSSAGMNVGDYFGLELDSGNLFWGTIFSIAGTTITLNTNLPSSSAANNIVFTYTVTAQQPVVMETVVLRDSDNNDTPIRLLTVQEYDYLPSKTNPDFVADPATIYYEFQLTNSQLFTDCAAAQDVTKHLAITYMEAVQDFVNPNDTPEYPQEWFLALAWGLAKQIAPMFNAPWTQNMQSNYDEAVTIARKKEPERTAMFFQPGEDGT